jgi:hypothetical protein
MGLVLLFMITLDSFGTVILYPICQLSLGSGGPVVRYKLFHHERKWSQFWKEKNNSKLLEVKGERYTRDRDVGEHSIRKCIVPELIVPNQTK